MRSIPWAMRTARPAAPVSFHTGVDVPSHVVLPFVEGSLGDEETAYGYRPRPFMPGVAR